MPLANEYLDDYFFIWNCFQGTGRTIGFPGKHKIEEDYKLIPHNGVYVVKSIINQKPFWNDEHGFNPLYGRKTVDRSPFF
jgi:riboflavin kinase/FMN adenylyltransferase